MYEPTHWSNYALSSLGGFSAPEYAASPKDV
jgi:hypothetical protein